MQALEAWRRCKPITKNQEEVRVTVAAYDKLQHCTCVTAGGAYLRFSLERIRFIHAMRCRPRVQSSTCLLTLRFYHYTFPGQISSTSLMDVARHTVCDFSSYLAVSQIIQYRPIRPTTYLTALCCFLITQIYECILYTVFTQYLM